MSCMAYRVDGGFGDTPGTRDVLDTTHTLSSTETHNASHTPIPMGQIVTWFIMIPLSRSI